MFITKYFNLDDNKISFTRQQASDFAKQVADDFNPLHDVTAKRFCVPGDLLFSVILAQAGLHKKMTFNFSGMVTNDIQLRFPAELSTDSLILDDNDKEYVKVSAQGEQSKDDTLIDSLVRAYVGFSGHTFPHILVKLMAENNVMINPARPMIMYESMSIELDTLDISEVSLELSESTLAINGKRGNAVLAFNLFSNGKKVGHGEKHMVLSGLREYCAQTMDTVSTDYELMKTAYFAAA